VAVYPFNTKIERLIDNYSQARGYMAKMEARLVKTRRLDEFNRQFQDNVVRGVFQALSKEEASRYKGLVNYISMVEAFKTGPHATIP
jgi:diacylglycerol kinase